MSEIRQRGIFARFFRRLFLIITGTFAMIGLLVVLVIGLVGYKAYEALKDGDRKVEAKALDLTPSLLKITLDRPISGESLSERERFFAQIFENELPDSLNDLQVTLRRAAEDTRVKGVVLDLENVSGSFSTLTALRRSLVEYAATGKPLYVNMVSGETPTYFLATAGSTINLAPVSGLSVPGPYFQLTYFAAALEKLGVEMEVVRAGKYKSAMESFVLNQPSPETLEMYGAIEGSLRGMLIEAIAAGRKKDPAVVDGWLKRSLFTSQQSLQQGLVDRIGYLPDWLEELKKSAQAENIVEYRKYFNGTNAMDANKTAPLDGKGESPSLAVIEATGEIVMSNPSSSRELISPKDTIEELQWARDDDSIKAVVLRIDSPGGSALASDLIWDEVRKLREKKPVVVSMGSVAASGGYYIAAPASLILAEPTTITGSIGVIGAMPKGLKMAEKWGVSFHMVTNSDRRGLLNFGAASSEQDKQILGESIDETYMAFVRKVAEGRKQTPEAIHAIAQGRVYSGAEALKIGLIDKLGGLKDAMREAKVLAQLDPEKLYPLERYSPEPSSFFDCLMEVDAVDCLYQLQDVRSFAQKIETERLGPLAPLARIQTLLQDSSVLAYWPGTLSWSKADGSRSNALWRKD